MADGHARSIVLQLLPHLSQQGPADLAVSMESGNRVLPGNTLRGIACHHVGSGRSLLPGPFSDDGKKVCGCIGHMQVQSRGPGTVLKY